MTVGFKRSACVLCIAILGSAWLAMTAGADTPMRASTQTSNDPAVSNSIGMTFVRIPAGTFTMGSPPGEPYRDHRETPHRVTISKSFYLQTTEVTLGQWRALMGRGWWLFDQRPGPDTLPVSRVCWHDVEAFIKRLNDLGEGRYRLPTEAEWEYAARAGSQSAYFWGDRVDCRKAMFANNSMDMDDCQKTIDAMGLPLDGPAPVRSYPPNAWGVYDMHGNVWEWVADWFGPYAAGDQVDPAGPATGTMRIKRGGSWFKHGYSMRSANRAQIHPATRLKTTGFRLVRMIELEHR